MEKPGLSEQITDLNDKNHAVQITEDPDESGREESPRKPLSFYMTFLALNISTFIVSLDATALAVAIPKITSELHGTTLEAFWTSLSFILTVVISQPIFTSVSDVVGRKTPFYVAYILFFAGSLIFALAPNMGVLILGRLIQGLGGGGLDVLSEVILVDITSLKERSLYLGLFALPMAGGAVFGPMIGAAFSEFVDWRWIGWINLPFTVVGVVLTICFMHLRPIEDSLATKLKRLDWTGMLLFGVGSTTFSLPLSWAGAMYPWSSWRTIFPLVIGVLVLIAFAFYESKPAEPIFPYRIFANRTAALTIIGSTLHGAAMYSSTFYGPLFFEAIKLKTPFKSAITILPGSASVIGFSIIAVIVVEYTRRYRMIVVFSWICGACGIGLWALWDSGSSDGIVAGLQVLFGVGVGSLFTVLIIPMQASVKNVDDTGIAAGTLVSFRLFGGLVGLALSAGIFNVVFQTRIRDVEDLPPDLEILKDIRVVIGFIPELRRIIVEPDILQGIVDAYRDAFRAVFYTLASLAGLGFFTGVFTKELTLEKEDLGRQRLQDTS